MQWMRIEIRPADGRRHAALTVDGSGLEHPGVWAGWDGLLARLDGGRDLPAVFRVAVAP